MRQLLYLVVLFSPACFASARTDYPETKFDVTDVRVMGFTSVGSNKEDWNATTILQANLKEVAGATTSNSEKIDRETIFVVPEYALTTTRVIDNYALALEMAQLVGEPGKKVLPCSSTNNQLDYMVIKELSCISRNNLVYLVAAILEKETRDCEAEETAPCFNVFSTTIVNDLNGYLIAKYRRFNSIEKSVLSRPAEATPTSFTTDSGVTFGLLTGHDLLFREPAQSLLKRNIKHFITNGAWKNTLPFGFSVNVFQGWIEANEAYLAAANYLGPGLGYTGIGTYRYFPGGSRRTETIGVGSGGHETIGDTLFNAGASNRGKRDLGEPGEVHTERADLSKFRTVAVPLSDASKQVHACHDGFCCTLSYKTDSTLNDHDVSYQLLVFSGSRTVEGVSEPVFLEQTCGLVACARLSGDEVDCSGPRHRTGYTESVSFSALSLQGFFSTNSVRPVTMSGEAKYNSISDPGRLTVETLSARNYTVKYELHKDLFVKVKTFALTATDVPPEQNASVLTAKSSALVLLIASAAKLL